MNTRLGKSFGLAFMVAVGILALMLALGTFNAQKAGAVVEDNVKLSLSNQNPDAHTEVTVSFTDSDALSKIEITFAGLDLADKADNYDGKVTVTGPTSETELAVTVENGKATTKGSNKLTLTVPDVDPKTDGEQKFVAGKYTVVIEAGNDAKPTIETSDSVAVATATVGEQKSDEVQIYDADLLSSQDAGAGVSVEIGFTTTDAISESDEIVIELKDFQVPATIDADAISIRGGKLTANAADVSVSVSGMKITAEIPDMDGSVDKNELPSGEVTIRIRTRAGVQNPTMSGDGYAVKVTHGSITLYDRNPGAINATLKVDPTSGLAGEDLTVSGVGYSTGTATIYHTGNAGVPDAGQPVPDDFTKIGSAAASGGSFSTSVTAGDAFGAAENDVIARSSTGAWGPTATFTVNGAISIPESVTKGTDLTINVSKWSAGDITRATINGANMNTTGEDKFTAVDPGQDGAAEFKIRVGAGALLGEQTLVLYTASGSAGSKNIDIIGIALTVSPSTAVVGQEVTVTGSGFTDSGEITSLKIGGVPVLGQIDDTDRDVASGGRVVAAFLIPDDPKLADADDYSISLSDGTRTGSATVTIPERTLTISPPEGRIGSRIDLSGTGWPTGAGPNLVRLYYGADQLSSATTDSSGEWTASITVPSLDEIGSTSSVSAKASVGDVGDNVTQSEDHKTPAPVVSVSPAQAQRGDTITVSGDNFHTFQPVRIDIGASNNVEPSATTTDGDGSFSVEVLVPGLSLGNKNLKVTVNEIPVVEFLEIVATPVSTTMASADVFAELVTADNLIVVWHFDNTTKDWSFYDPRPAVAGAVDLKMVSTGDNVWIQITANQTFQGETLTAGWNLVTLD